MAPNDTQFLLLGGTSTTLTTVATWPVAPYLDEPPPEKPRVCRRCAMSHGSKPCRIKGRRVY